MGNKIGFAALCLAASRAAVAADVDTHLDYSRDESGYVTSGVKISGKATSESVISPLLSSRRWIGNQTHTSNGVGSNIGWWSNNTAVNGYFIKHPSNSVTFLESDLTISHTVMDGLRVDNNFSSDTYASNKLAPGTINWRSITSGVEWSNSKYGGIINYRYLHRTDGSHQRGPGAKVWVVPSDGLSIYLYGRGHSNSMSSPLYFSPAEYNRYGVGGSYRFGWSGGRAGVTLEYSDIVVNGSRDKALVYKVDYNQRLSSNSRLILNTGRDYSTIGNYSYNYATALIKFSF